MLESTSQDLRAYETKVELHSSNSGFSCIKIVLADKRQGDLPVPRFTWAYLTEQEKERQPFLIGMPNLLKECGSHVPPNGGTVTHHGRQLNVDYALMSDDLGQSEILYNAQDRLAKRLDAIIEELDRTYMHSPYADFVLMKR